MFFDEVSELPLETQIKLLRLLQEREYEPLRSMKPRKADVRVVAATNKRLFELVSKESFRDDLYFRLAVVQLSIPPLRERREVIPHLVEHFISRFNATRGKRIEGVTPAVRYAKQVPGHHIQVDVKFLGMKTAEGNLNRWYQYTASNDATRIRASRIYRRHNQKNAIDFIDYVIEKFPFRIHTVRTDRWHEFQA